MSRTYVKDVAPIQEVNSLLLGEGTAEEKLERVAAWATFAMTTAVLSTMTGSFTEDPPAKVRRMVLAAARSLLEKEGEHNNGY